MTITPHLLAPCMGDVSKKRFFVMANTVAPTKMPIVRFENAMDYGFNPMQEKWICTTVFLFIQFA